MHELTTCWLSANWNNYYITLIMLWQNTSFWREAWKWMNWFWTGEYKLIYFRISYLSVKKKEKDHFQQFDRVLSMSQDINSELFRISMYINIRLYCRLDTKIGSQLVSTTSFVLIWVFTLLFKQLNIGFNWVDLILFIFF